MSVDAGAFFEMVMSHDDDGVVRALAEAPALAAARALGWAEHGGHAAIVALLETAGAGS